MAKSLKLPAEKRNSVWSLTTREYLFLDLSMILNMKHAEVYRLVYGTNLTDAQLANKASALITSADAVEYLAIRRKQLEEHFWGEESVEGEVTKKKQQSTEDVLAELIPDIVRDLKDIARNKNDENYPDLVKTVLSKLMKDLDTKNAASPPLRYLPEIPCQGCRYKIFCENECDDECKICRFKKYGIEHGLNYDYKNQLEK